MSGIVGILSLDGRPISEEQLSHLTEQMRFCGPDAQTMWVCGRVGFGHTLLRTTDLTADDGQLISFDDQLHIVADARIDGRAELVAKLAARGRAGLESASDAELILHAYVVWGEACVDHLLGDFAFAVWDDRQERLFGARDHFGIKPFYYATTSEYLVFSNVLGCLRAHPGISNRLNDLAVADFLLFGGNQELDTTIFVDIQRLPPAHILVLEPGQAVRTRRYWSLPTDGSTRYKDRREYVDQYLDLLREAVSDRLRTRRVGVYMSGGLDSTSVAAIARESLAASSEAYDLRAYTLTRDQIIPDDQESYYAGLAADYLGMAHHRISAVGYKLYGGWENPSLPTPEPVDVPLWAVVVDQARTAAEHGRVVLTGQGGDPSHYPSRFYLYELLKKGRIKELAADLGAHLRIYGRLPPLYIRMIAGGARGGILPRSQNLATFPAWLNPSFVGEMKLRERWEAYHHAISERPANAHPLRPEVSQNLSAPLWPNMFEHHYQASSLGALIEVRHPLLDVRVLSYLLSLPPVPWFVNKTLVRLAMKNKLPQAVRLREKTVATGQLIMGLLRRKDGIGEIDLDRFPDLEYYLDREQFSRIVQMRSQLRTRESQIATRPLSLYYWLGNQI